MLQNATPLMNSAPWPPNISDEHVSCTAPATQNASLQILFKSPTPAIVFWNATEPSRFAHFWQGAKPLAPATQNHILPKVLWEWCALYILTSKCASRNNGVHFFRHLNLQKCSEAAVLCTFWLRNDLRATKTSTFSTSQLLKVLRTWCVLYILTSKCVSRHNDVHFFNISTSKSAPDLVCFEHFDFEMCFAPQRRALFQHLNF